MQDAITTGQLTALIALAMGLVKVIETAVGALARRIRPPRPQMVEVKLLPADSEALHDVRERVARMDGILAKTDNDGTPMVYSSRTGTEAVRDTAVIIRSIQQTQERILALIERLEDRFAQHDANDQKIQVSIVSTLERIAKVQEDHDRWSRDR